MPGARSHTVVRSGRADLFRTREFQDMVMAAARGGPDEINRLFRLVHPIIVRYCRARVGVSAGNGDADDVAQEVCAGLLAALPRYVQGDDRFLAFLYGIAGHKVVDHFRRCGRDRTDPAIELPERIDPSPGPETLAVARADFTQVATVLNRLTNRQRQVLALRVVAGLSSAHAAEVIGVSPVAVRVTQRRALARARAALGTELDPVTGVIGVAAEGCGHPDPVSR
jgi:RNA polymerase sigma-70 factor (ECF subfamily)